jgi:uncharacterized protein
MRLAIPSLVLFLYIFASLICFLPCRPLVKVAAGIVFFVIGLKYLIYEQIGGSFIAPGLPHPFLLSMEVLYGAMVILAFLLLVKDGLALVLCLGRCLGQFPGICRLHPQAGPLWALHFLKHGSPSLSRMFAMWR